MKKHKFHVYYGYGIPGDGADGLESFGTLADANSWCEELKKANHPDLEYTIIKGTVVETLRLGKPLVEVLEGK